MVFSNLPSLVITVISAPGMATAFTNPLSSTINLLVSLDSQNTIVFVASDGSILTDSCNVPLPHNFVATGNTYTGNLYNTKCTAV